MGDGAPEISVTDSGARRLIRVVLTIATMTVAQMSLSATVTAAVENCYDVWPGSTRYWGEWDTATGSAESYLPCELYEPASSELSREFGVDVKIYLPGEMQDSENPDRTLPGWLEAPHPDATPDAPQLIVEATRKTLAELSPHLEPINIHIVLLQNVSEQHSDREWDWDTTAEAGVGDPCPVTVYVTDLIDVADDGNRPTDPLDVKSTIAHEIYHCYQKEYFSDQITAAHEEEDGWWVEGTAEFMANRIFPCSPFAAGYAGAYRMATRLNRQDGGGYANYIFYMHLADRYGFDIPALMDFTGRMPEAPGADAQDEALSAYPGIGEKFHSFAQAYVDGDISHCVRGNVVIAPPENFEAADGLEIPLDGKPFTFEASIVRLEKGKAYRIRLVDPAGDGESRRTSYRLAAESGQAAWNPMPGDFTLAGGCEEAKRYVMMSTVEGVDDSVHEAKLVFQELDAGAAEDIACRRCDRPGWYRSVELDNCLVGQWEWQSGGKWDTYGDALAFIGEQRTDIVSYTVRSGAAGNRLTILSDGTYQYGGGRVWLNGNGTQQRNGTETNFSHSLEGEVLPGIGAWRIDRGKLRICDIHTPGEGAFNATVQSGEMAALSSAMQARAHQTQHIVKGKYDYSCNASELRIAKDGPPIPGVTPLEWMYRRLSGPEGDAGGTPTGGE